MSGPEVFNQTRAAVSVAPCFDPRGQVAQVVIVKHAFALGTGASLEPVGGAEVLHADVPWDASNPSQSSVRYPSDLCLAKPSTDVVVLGRAVSPDGRARPSLDVRVRAASLDVTLRAWGPRAWERGATGLSAGASSPALEVPLRWELAWGGCDLSDPRRPVEEPRNPVGRGVGRASAGEAAHQIEFARAADHPRGTPAGVGAIAPHWAPRRGYVGTLDARWMAERMPLPPVDQDPRFHQVAPPWLIAPSLLVGAEPVVIEGMRAGAPIAFALPRFSFLVRARADRTAQELATRLDTVLIDVDEGRVEVVHRAAVLEGTGPQALRAVTVCPRGGRP